jgi:hypothetical protein
MPFFKHPSADVTSVVVMGIEFDAIKGFIQFEAPLMVDDKDISIDVERALVDHAGWRLATNEEVSAAFSETNHHEDAKAEVEERDRLIVELKKAGMRVDGRKSLSFLRERFEDAVASGAIAQADTESKLEPEPKIAEMIIPPDPDVQPLAAPPTKGKKPSVETPAVG